MQRSLSVATIAVALAMFSFRSAIVEGLFMDMYGKLFQVELLDDCSVYAYDRVFFFSAPRSDWCKLKKSCMVSGVATHDGVYTYLYTIAIYRDDDNVVKMYMIERWNEGGSDFQAWNRILFSQDIFEATEQKVYHVDNIYKSVKHTPTEYGRYYMVQFIPEKHICIAYEGCKYGKTTTKNIARKVCYDDKTRNADVEILYDCNSNVETTQLIRTLLAGQFNVTVYIDPENPKEKQCSVGNEKFVLRSIKQSIQTSVVAYSLINNWTFTFDASFLKQMNEYKPKFRGAEKDSNNIVFNGKKYTRPKIDHDYTEQPFFFYDATTKMYSPFFLYYKFTGIDRRFTVRFVYNDKFHDIFTPMEYMKQCEFPTSDSKITVAAAPRVIKQDEESISVEVYFLINNADFKFCVFDVEFKYNNEEHGVNLKLTSEINAYVHVQTRSTTAANCAYDGGRTVRWLLAYSKNGDAELVSLDNSLSSPIFPCPHCGPNSKMYCDISPEAKKYHSAMFIHTVENGETDVTNVRVVNARGYELRIEYHTFELSGEFYFVQNIDLKLELQEIWVRLQEGKAKNFVGVKTHTPGFDDEPKITPSMESNKDEPDDDDDYGPDWLNAKNSDSLYWLFISFSLFILA